MNIHVAVFAFGIFVLGLAVGFEVCMLTLFRRAVAIARESVATAKRCIAELESFQDDVKRIYPESIREQPKTVKKYVH